MPVASGVFGGLVYRISLPLDNQQTQKLFVLPQASIASTNTHNSAAQIVPSGPGYGRENNRDVMIAFIYAAQAEVCIATPYFIPDDSFLTALVAAARRGVHVQLIFPQHSNQFITNLAQQSYFTQLLRERIEIYLYQPGLLHAKHMVFDNQIVLAGSSNIDVRSFALNAEISTVIYDAAIAGQFRQIQQNYIAKSLPVSLDAWQKRPRIRKIASNLARLADALL